MNTCTELDKPPVSIYLEDFKNHDPQLFLATFDHTLEFKDKEVWKYYDHQAGGVACNHIGFFGRKFSLREPDLWETYITAPLYGSNVGVFGVTFSELKDYERRLKSVHTELTFDFTYYHFQESVYPIDFLPENTILLSDAEVPEDPNDEIILNGRDRLYGCLGRFVWLVLAQNSD